MHVVFILFYTLWSLLRYNSCIVLFVIFSICYTLASFLGVKEWKKLGKIHFHYCGLRNLNYWAVRLFWTQILEVMYVLPYISALSVPGGTEMLTSALAAAMFDCNHSKEHTGFVSSIISLVGRYLVIVNIDVLHCLSQFNSTTYDKKFY